MAILLLLGSKPDPAIPAQPCDALACVNGSGHSAATYGLGEPDFTVMTANLTSGSGLGRYTIEAIAGLSTRRLHCLARPPADYRPRNLLRRYRYKKALPQVQPDRLKVALAAVGYCYREFHVVEHAAYYELLGDLFGRDAEVMALLRKKQPSTGIAALILALERGGFDRYVLSGFDFQTSHAYWTGADNEAVMPNRHAETDTAVVRALARRLGDRLVTTEPALSAATGLDLVMSAAVLPDAVGQSEPLRRCGGRRGCGAFVPGLSGWRKIATLLPAHSDRRADGPVASG